MTLKNILAALWLTTFAAAATPVLAIEHAPMTAEVAAAKRARALDLRNQARTLRQAGDAVRQQEASACQNTVLVNNCLRSADDRRLERIRQARLLESEVNTLERELRRYDLSERRAERAKRLEKNTRPATVTVDGAPTALPGGPAASAPDSR